MQMHKPDPPKPFRSLLQGLRDPAKLDLIIASAPDSRLMREYLHWDKLRRLTPPQGLTTEEWWLGLKFRRLGQFRPVPLQDKNGGAFQFLVPDIVLESLHTIDRLAGGSLRMPEPITNPQTRDQYLIRSLMEEAITSSQLEGAVTTREVAKEMIRTGRPPRDKSEQMILNNYITMRRIVEIKDQEMTPDLVLELHRLVTEKTLDDPDMAGRFRLPDQKIVVDDVEGEVYHEPPPAEQLAQRCQAMCDFANEKTPDYFIHPVVRSIILHFWLAYDHPFVDGNGRTARALFYWAMLHRGFWLFEFISISTILRKAPAKYARSFLYTETDDNDLTYFIVYQAEVIQRAIEDLHAYIDRKTAEVRESESKLKALRMFNHRQTDLIRHALKHPHQEYDILSHQKSHGVVYQTARTDLLQLQAKGLLDVKKRGKAMVFTPPRDLAARLRKPGQEPAK
jgi:Fic family protein